VHSAWFSVSVVLPLRLELKHHNNAETDTLNWLMYSSRSKDYESFSSSGILFSLESLSILKKNQAITINTNKMVNETQKPV
jgi:hypothetical protein